MSRPTTQEAQLIEQLRDRLGDALKSKEQQSDVYLIRWLRARNLNLEKAESMLRNSLKWREEHDMENSLTRAFDPSILANYPFFVDTVDNEGHPVTVIPFGIWDMRKAIDGGLEDQLIDYTSFIFESILAAIRKRNLDLKEGDYPISQTTVILDWENFAYSQLFYWKALEKLFKMAATYEAHYPEILYRGIFINCPSFFPAFMKLWKPFMATATFDKISCHSNREEWEPLLHKSIAADQLTPNFGGTHDPTRPTSI